MGALIRFFMRFATFFEFLFLELIAFLFIVNFGAFQQSVFYKFNASMVASIYSVTSTCADYFNLRNENARLVAENEQLLNRLAQLESHDADSLLTTQAKYRTSSARVVYGTVNLIQNFLIINRGSADSIAVDMGVMNADGVVGVVESVSKHYAVVMPIINTNSLISGKLAKNDYLGSVSWDGISPEFAEFTEIPYHVDVAVGDTVVTSGYSAIFAADVPIGIVEQVEKNDNLAFCKIKLRLLANYRTLNNVHVVDCAHREELNQIVKSVQNK